MDQSFEGFTEQVRATIELHARRKGYTTGGGEEGNVAGEILKLLGIAVPHEIGEIIYKAVEFLKTPRRVILEKIAGWCYIAWRDCGD